LGSLTVWITVGPTGSGISPQDIMSKYSKDKERMDEIAERIAYRQPLKEWACIYWMAVAIGHLLEWVVRRTSE